MAVNIYGKSPEIQESIRTAEIIAATDVTTLIMGETGTGKELFANYIVEKSPRKNKAFITINCAALADTLIESALFGHKKGAFADAVEAHRGYIAEAHGGTLFLDEIAELSLKAQSQLLRFIETGECQKVGSNSVQHYNVRILAATNKNLLDEANAGRFRQDLFYRLNIVPLELAPLRERQGDIAVLQQHFFQDLVKKYRLTPPSISKLAQDYINRYTWNGNVRELKNFCERMLILFAGKTIEITNLPTEIRKQKRPNSRYYFELPKQGIQLEALEMDLYEQAIQNSHGNKSAAARLLGLSRDAFLYRLKKYRLM